MRRVWLGAAMALWAFGSTIGARSAAADQPGHPDIGGIGFPTYTREEIVDVCLAEYGTENASTLDCVAKDETYRSALLKRWPEIADPFRKTCLLRLANQHLNSDSHLDRCIRWAEKDKDAPPDD